MLDWDPEVSQIIITHFIILWHLERLNLRRKVVAGFLVNLEHLELLNLPGTVRIAKKIQFRWVYCLYLTVEAQLIQSGAQILLGGFDCLLRWGRSGRTIIQELRRLVDVALLSLEKDGGSAILHFLTLLINLLLHVLNL